MLLQDYLTKTWLTSQEITEQLSEFYPVIDSEVKHVSYAFVPLKHTYEEQIGGCLLWYDSFYKHWNDFKAFCVQNFQVRPMRFFTMTTSWLSKMNQK